MEERKAYLLNVPTWVGLKDLPRNRKLFIRHDLYGEFNFAAVNLKSQVGSLRRLKDFWCLPKFGKSKKKTLQVANTLDIFDDILGPILFWDILTILVYLANSKGVKIVLFLLAINHPFQVL